MARFEKIHTPIFVSAYRPGIDRTPPWAKSLPAKGKVMKPVKPGDWLVKENNSKTGIVRVAKADFMKLYRLDK